MSNPIRKNVVIDGSVKIGENISDIDSGLSIRKSSRNSLSLNFRDTIDRETKIWKNKLDQKVEAFDESIEQKIKEAYNKGLEDGVIKEQSEREKYISDHFFKQFGIINSLLNETKQKNRDAFRGLEKKIINLSVAIAEKIIHVNINNEPEMIKKLVAETMSEMISGDTVILKICPHDYTIINSEYEKWHGMSDNVVNFKIESDKRLGVGDCIIESEGGIVDSTIKSRLQNIAEALLKINH